MAESFRAGGIHWAATMDAGGFAKGARVVKAEATRLQQELKAIAKMDSPFAQRILGARAVESERIRAAEQERFHKQTSDNMQAALRNLAKYEASSAAVVVGNQKQATSFKELNASLKAAFGRGSDFKEFIELVAGAGAIAGIGMLANSFGRLGDSVKQATMDMANGLKTYKDVMAEFVQGIPILGGFIRGGAGIIGSLDTGKGSIFGRQVEQARARDANTQFLRMMEDLQSRERASRSPAAGIRESERQQISALMRLRDTKGIGERQFQLGSEAVKRETDRLLKDLEPNKLAARIGDLFQTKANTVNHWLKKMQADVEAFNERVDKRLEAATARWADRIQTKWNTFMHAFARLDKQRQDFEEKRQARADRQDDFIGGARGFFDRLKEIERAEVRFGSGVERGTQEDFANRQRAIFNPTIFRQDEKELARKAIKLQEETLKENKEINRLLRDTAKKLGVTDFN